MNTALVDIADENVAICIYNLNFFNPGDIVNFCILSHIYIHMSGLCCGPLKRMYSDPKNVLCTKYRNMYSYKNEKH